MLIRNKTLAAVWKWLVFLAAFFAVALQCGLFREKWDFTCLTYFTLMSNLACVIYYPMAAVYQLRTGRSWKPMVKGAILMCISVTGLVYHFMLHGRFEMQGTILLSNILLHYVVPVCTVLDWVIFDEKGHFSVKTAGLWLLAPLGYFIFVMIAVAMGAHLGPYGERYPYFFMDVDVLGFWTVFLTGLVMELCFFLLGLFWVWLDKILARRGLKTK